MPPRVTNAELATMLESLDEKVGDISSEIKAMNGRQRTDHDKITTLEANLSTTTKAQAALTLVASIIAATIGVNINR